MFENSRISEFFSKASFKTKEDSLVFDGIACERLYFGYYSGIINAFKSKVDLVIPENRSVKASSWEPLLKSAHHGIFMSFMPYVTKYSTMSESAILMDLFQILKLSGFGDFQLSLPVPGSVMSISVVHSLDSYADMAPGISPESRLSAFTAGIVLACYNFSMTLDKVVRLDESKVNDIYMNSPEIRQVGPDRTDSGVVFTITLN